MFRRVFGLALASSLFLLPAVGCHPASTAPTGKMDLPDSKPPQAGNKNNKDKTQGLPVQPAY